MRSVTVQEVIQTLSLQKDWVPPCKLKPQYWN